MILLNSDGSWPEGKTISLHASQKVIVLEIINRLPNIAQILGSRFPTSAEPYGLAEVRLVDAPDYDDQEVGGLIVVRLTRGDTGEIVELALIDRDAWLFLDQVPMSFFWPIGRNSKS